MTMTSAEKQKAFRTRQRDPVSRKTKLDNAKAIIVGLKQEADAWLKAVPDSYEDRNDDNASRVSDVEAYVEALDELLEHFDIETPRFNKFRD